MDTATPVVGALVVRVSHLIDNERIIEVDCDDYDAFKKLPQVVRFRGTILGKTGWTSDRNRACYKSNVSVAFAHDKG